MKMTLSLLCLWWEDLQGTGGAEEGHRWEKLLNLHQWSQQFGRERVSPPNRHHHLGRKAIIGPQMIGRSVEQVHGGRELDQFQGRITSERPRLQWDFHKQLYGLRRSFLLWYSYYSLSWIRWLWAELCFPQSPTLTSLPCSDSECGLMCRQGLYRGCHAGMRSSVGSWSERLCPVKKGIPDRDREQEVHVEIQGDDSHLQAPESGLEHILPSRPLEGTSPVDIRIPSF